ncbi:MAG: sugar phosphate isomerase/epimerase [Limnochordia bacterium]|jgi:sugar phosphate isomerase/epimerase|nr:sugar phosphate isomerase/epimerase [Limnochordia bacterium]MDI9464396.1 sugar phosphate isomerase/epimerase [Bacillota bacterium]NLO95297.1 sugar phosphate isomerase/epimerase [Bacillota bacterium]HAI51734.1 AP endonuclease [Bacillota bacterium]HAN95897.1 AP endonuclease [Bacillota bacterium]
MKLGFLSAIVGFMSFEQVIDTASSLGYRCVELACWPREEASRRYAGVSHLNVAELDDAQIAQIQDYCRAKGVEISSLGYYPNNLDEDLERRRYFHNHLYTVIEASARLGINMVTTFVGRMQTKTIEENFEEFAKVWPAIIKFAEERGVKIAIENCPMLFSRDQWPGGHNIASTPANWRKMFEIIDSPNFGLNYDPSHFVWQQMDYIKPIYEFKDKIFHIHLKDTRIERDRLNDVGIMAYPLQYMTAKIPGLGEINWGRFVSALTDIGFDGPACVEVEDRAFEDSEESVLKSLKLSKRYLEQFII